MNTHILMHFDEQQKARVTVATDLSIDRGTARALATLALNRRLELQGRANARLKDMATVDMGAGQIEYNFVGVHAD